MLFIFFVIAVSAFLSWLLLQSLLPVLRRLLLDLPNERSSHVCPTPRGGGIVFVFAVAAASLTLMINGNATPAVTLPLLSVPLAVVGLLDDRYSLPVLWRYTFQFFTSIAILLSSPLFYEYYGGGLAFLPFLFFIVIAATAVINFINFMDGVDGLIAGCLLVAISALTVAQTVSWTMWVLVGSLFAFLCLNWHPAKLFMGDVGSTFLGAIFVGLVLHSSSWLDSIGFLLVGTPFLADPFICLIRRFFAGHRVFLPHRLHLFQRLQQAGWPHSRVSLTYICATFVLAFAMLCGGFVCVLCFSIVLFMIGVWLDQCVAVPFKSVSNS